MACALSSITNKLCSLAIAIIASIFAARPNKCTGIMALVFGVIAFLMASIEMFILYKSTSTKTGVSCNKAITSTVAAKVKSAVITSSPGFKSNAIMAICNASVPLAHGITCCTFK